MNLNEIREKNAAKMRQMEEAFSQNTELTEEQNKKAREISCYIDLMVADLMEKIEDDKGIPPVAAALLILRTLGLFLAFSGMPADSKIPGKTFKEGFDYFTLLNKSDEK